MAQHDDADAGNDAWTWAALEPEPTEREKALLDLFCQEYLVDSNATLAASRCGFQAGFAEEYGKRFFQRAYVQRKLRALLEAEPEAKAEEKYNRRLVINTLREVAANKYQKATARVAAARGLASIYGMDAPIKTQNTNINKGGVLVVPAIASIEDWEAAAKSSQGKLMEDSRVD